MIACKHTKWTKFKLQGKCFVCPELFDLDGMKACDIRSQSRVADGGNPCDNKNICKRNIDGGAPC